MGMKRWGKNEKGKRCVQLSEDLCPWERLIFLKCHSVLGKMETPPGNASPDRQDRLALPMDIITTTKESGLLSQRSGGGASLAKHPVERLRKFPCHQLLRCKQREKWEDLPTPSSPQRTKAASQAQCRQQPEEQRLLGCSGAEVRGMPQRGSPGRVSNTTPWMLNQNMLC